MGGLNVLLTGAAGVVGTAMIRSVPDGVRLSGTVRATPVAVPEPRATIAAVELTDPAQVDRLVEHTAPDVVVHSAASMRSRSDVVEATGCVASAAASAGAALVHLSTDMVFDGERPPYSEASTPAPVTDYGRWKLEAEQLAASAVPDVTITRTSLVVSLHPPDRTSAALLDAVRAGRPPTVFEDELRSPIRADDLAARLWALIDLDRNDRAGVWHLPGPEVVSRQELATRLCRAAGLDPGGLQVGSVRHHPSPRPRDLTLTSTRPRLLEFPSRSVG